MSRDNAKQKRKLGRPSTGRRPMIGLRLADEETIRLDAWATSYGLTRSEAIRRLIQKGLEAEVSQKETQKEMQEETPR